jgi:hypothetical protein
MEESPNPLNLAHMGGPSQKGSPNLSLFLAPKTYLTHLGKGREGQVWMVVISYRDWRLEGGRGMRESPCGIIKGKVFIP